MSGVPELCAVDLPHGRAAWRECGSGFPVIVIAGLGLSSRFYERSYEPFAAAGLRLIVPDLPGTGGTPGPRAGLDPNEVTAFITTFTHALGIPRALFVGHSLGAQAALLLAMRAPDLTAGVALVGPTGSLGSRPLLHQMRGLAGEALRVSPRVIGAVARDYLRVSPVKYLGTWIRHRDPVAESRLPEVTCPVLLLIGGRDTVVDREYLTLLRRELPDVTVTELPAASHALPRSQFRDFNHGVIGFAHAFAG